MLIEEVSEVMLGRFLTGNSCRNKKYKQIRYIMRKGRVGYIKNEWQISLGLIVHVSLVNHKQNGKQNERN